MAEHSINVKLTYDESGNITGMQPLQKEVAKSTNMINRFNAGGAKAVNILFNLNGALHGTTEGLKGVLSLLGQAAGSAGVVALTIKGLMEFDTAVRESAKKLHQSWNSLTETATLVKYERIYEKEGKDITLAERDQAERDMEAYQKEVVKQQNKLVEMEKTMYQKRAAGQKYDPGTDYTTKKADLAMYKSLMEAASRIVDKYDKHWDGVFKERNRIQNSQNKEVETEHRAQARRDHANAINYEKIGMDAINAVFSESERKARLGENEDNFHTIANRSLESAPEAVRKRIEQAGITYASLLPNVTSLSNRGIYMGESMTAMNYDPKLIIMRSIYNTAQSIDQQLRG